MKKVKTITLLFSLLVVLSCSIRIKNKYQSSNYNTMINSNTEYFDFKKIGDSFNTDGYAEKTYELPNAVEAYYTRKSYSSYVYGPKLGWFSIYKKYYKNGVIENKYVIARNGQKFGKEYFYDETGKLTKETDHDKGYHLRLEQVVDLAIELCKKYGFDANIGMESPMQGQYWDDDHTTIWRMDEKGKRWYIESRKPIKERVMGPIFDIQKNRSFGMTQVPACQYLAVIIDDTTGKILFEELYIERYDGGRSGHPTLIEEMYEKEKKKTSSIYKTYEGKTYTQAEWKVYEQEQYNEHLRKTGRADLIKPTETSKTEIKKSNFLADEDDVKPKKKKWFWG